MANNTDSGVKARHDALISGKYLGMRAAVYAYIRKHIGNTEDSEDLLQETFTRLLEYRTVLTGDTLDRLIYRIARNLIVDWYRRHASSGKAREYFSWRHRDISEGTEDAGVRM